MDTNLLQPVHQHTAPVLSVIVLCYRQGEYVGPCLQSILDQKLDVPFEVIVGDDNSPDNSLDVIESFRSQYPDAIKVISHDANVGFAANFADTVAMANGEYIANIDGDDVMLPGKLQRQLDFLREHPECGLVVHRMRTVDQDTLESVPYPLPQKKPATFDAAYLIKNGPHFFHSSEMYRAHLRHRSPVDVGLKAVCDLAHLVQVVVGSQGCYLDEEWGLYRVNRTGMTSLGINNPERHRENTNDMIQTCQIAADLGVASDAVNRGRARFYLTSAIFYLEHGRDDGFEDCIELSWRAATLGMKQLVLYSLRRWPRVLRKVYTRLKQMARRQRVSA
ncbi:glycosyltransferase involved in cell wall biosynthesis [Paraburkholderia sp. BL6669N2]|uniref:glycosyltransferase family 2 protein n=1 Tax=Paraburkholderia sp. BL6669N2 TaxID=1938807 RepID=UPI000E228D1A|nr:glycosyltransferase family 2 protein [Paraburkholderia sp. BL6669N2]REG61288.1 glycosyltransferase involved in cell wall biosynthesis [Paraburkholderia sp. BL6669N2]